MNIMVTAAYKPVNYEGKNRSRFIIPLGLSTVYDIQNKESDSYASQ